MARPEHLRYGVADTVENAIENAMSLLPDYQPETHQRADIDALPGITVLEFGASWCGHCLAASPLISEVLAGEAAVRHIRVADGPGRPLGRSYRVKLWPTLIFLRDGQEIARVVRPTATGPLSEALAQVQ